MMLIMLEPRTLLRVDGATIFEVVLKTEQTFPPTHFCM